MLYCFCNMHMNRISFLTKPWFRTEYFLKGKNNRVNKILLLSQVLSSEKKLND